MPTHYMNQMSRYMGGMGTCLSCNEAVDANTLDSFSRCRVCRQKELNEGGY